MAELPRILVCGGRDFGNAVSPQLDSSPENLSQIAKYKFIHEYLNGLIDANEWWHDEEYLLPAVVIISGGARGVDHAAIDWAVVNWCRVDQFSADWNRDGKRAGPIRNQRMIDEGKPDLVVAFPGGRGTADMVRRAKKHNIEVIEVEYNGI